MNLVNCPICDELFYVKQNNISFKLIECENYDHWLGFKISNLNHEKDKILEFYLHDTTQSITISEDEITFDNKDIKLLKMEDIDFNSISIKDLINKIKVITIFQ